MTISFTQNSARRALPWAMTILLLISVTTHAQDRVFTGLGDGTNWNDPNNWQPADVPNTATENAIIDQNGVFSVDINGVFSIGTVSIGGDDEVTLLNGQSLIVDGAITNNLFRLSSSGLLTSVRIQDGTILAGPGTWRMSDNSNNVIGGFGASNVLTNGPDHTIAGSGQLGGNTIGLINNGVIDADQPTELVIEPSSADAGGGANFVNNNILRASNGGTLVLQGGRFDNTNGTIFAADESTVSLRTGAEIEGGFFNSAGNGQIIVENGQDPLLRGVITNNRLIEQVSSGDLTRVRIQGDTMLIGRPGIWRMSDNTNNVIGGLGASFVLTNDTLHTIAGSGQLGGNTIGLINNGVIDADQPTELVIEPSSADAGGGANFVNNNILRASNGGTLVLQGGRFDNTNGTILAADESTVSLRTGADIEGGFFDFAGNGQIIIENGQDLLLRGVITNNRLIEQVSSGDLTRVRIPGDTMLTGPGIWRLSDNTNNVIGGLGASFVLTNDTDHTIAGSGQLGGNTIGLINNGVIDADQPTELVIEPSSADAGGGANFVNNHILRASNGGTLVLQGGRFDNTNGVITSPPGTTVSLRTGADIEGGVLDGFGQIIIENGQDVVFGGEITNIGSLAQVSSGDLTRVRLQGDTMLTGPGIWRLSDNTNNVIGGLGASFVLTNDTHHTIAGSGQLGGNTIGLINNGVIDADQPTELVIEPSSADAGDGANVLNELGGRLLGSGTGGMVLTGGIFVNQRGGEISAGSLVTVTSLATLENRDCGIVSGEGTLTFEQVGGGLSNDGYVSPGPSPGTTGQLSIVGSYTQTEFGSLVIDIPNTSDGTFDRLDVSETAALDGQLIVKLGSGMVCPQSSDEFLIVDANEVFGTFSNTSANRVSFEGGQFDVVYNSDSVVLTNFVPVGAVNISIDQVAKLLPDDGVGGDRFGRSLAISDSTAIVGGVFSFSVGSEKAYLFDATTGQQFAKLLPNDGAPRGFGFSVSIGGTTAIAGARFDDDNGEWSGSAHTFDTTTGQQQFKILPDDGATGDEFGNAVAVSGTTAIVGAWRDDDNGLDSGSAYLFDTTTGQQLFKLLPDDGAPDGYFGGSVAISGSIAVVGNPTSLNTDGEAAYLFNINTGLQIAKLIPGDGALNIDFGGSVAIEGTTVIVGAKSDRDNGPASGSAYLFDTTSGQQLFKLLPDDGVGGDAFGGSVAINGTTAVVGAFSDDDNGAGSGSAYLFDTTSGQQIDKFVPDDGATGDLFGGSVGIAGTTVIVGSFDDDDNGDDSGSAYLFEMVCLAPVPDDVVPDSFLVTRGTHVAGGVVELAESDNLDLSLQRSSTDIQSRTEFEVKAVSPDAHPSRLEVTLEGSVFARSQVQQTIELFDYFAGEWEQVDTRPATRFTDSTVTVAPTGNLTRFVECNTKCIQARVRYQSVFSPRQRFASNIDQFKWTIR